MDENFVKHVQTLFGDRLVSIASYYMDHEQYFLFVFKESKFSDLMHGKDLNIKEPILFFTEEELSDGKDVFSLEFLNIKNSYEMVFGKDHFKNMKFKKQNVRLQLEFELRSKLINLRVEFMRVNTNVELLKLINSILPAFMPLVSGLLFLKGVAMPQSKEEIFKTISQKYKVSTAVLNTIYQYKLKNIDLEDYTGVIKDVLKFLAEIAEEVDELKV